MSATSAQPDKRRILLVDDIELNRTLTEAILRAGTYEVDSVSDGGAALAALERASYDLVLMDLDMPGLDGHEAAAAIRHREAEAEVKRTVKVAALSARGEAGARLRSVEVGMAAHIARPIAPHELLRQIERVFCQPAAPQPDPWHRDAYEEWVARLGADRMRTFLATLLDQFRSLSGLLQTDAETGTVHMQAHDVASTGGMLGFPDVTTACRAVLEAASGEDEAAKAKLETALDRAIARLDQHFSQTSAMADAA